MRILVAYGSLTGNTEKIARAIAEEVGGEALHLPQPVDPDEYDFVFAGFWCDKGHPDDPFADFFKKVGDKPCAVFGTMGGDPASERGSAWVEKVKAERFAAPNIADVRLWQGRIDPKVIEMMAKLPGAAPMTEERRKRLDEAAKHPTAEDLQEAKAWARSILDSLK